MKDTSGPTNMEVPKDYGRIRDQSMQTIFSSISSDYSRFSEEMQSCSLCPDGEKYERRIYFTPNLSIKENKSVIELTINKFKSTMLKFRT